MLDLVTFICVGLIIYVWVANFLEFRRLRALRQLILAKDPDLLEERPAKFMPGKDNDEIVLKYILRKKLYMKINDKELRDRCDAVRKRVKLDNNLTSLLLLLGVAQILMRSDWLTFPLAR